MGFPLSRVGVQCVGMSAQFPNQTFSILAARGTSLPWLMLPWQPFSLQQQGVSCSSTWFLASKVLGGSNCTICINKEHTFVQVLAY